MFKAVLPWCCYKAARHQLAVPRLASQTQHL
jgi:hypothetical protein